MKRIISDTILFALALLLFVSCEEFGPVFTGKYPDPAPYEPVTLEANCSIKELKAKYVHSTGPIEIEDDLIIKGQLISNDQPGNIYRTMYIQDETGAIEVKIGKTGLYNDYKPGQWIYVKCKGLTLGGYRGMTSIGWKSNEDKYENSYIDTQIQIDAHIFRGGMGEPVAPVEMTEADLGNPDFYGKYVTMKGLIYDNETFTLVYLDPDGNREDYTGNCIFLDEEGGTWGITTWAMSDTKFTEYLDNGNFDAGTVAGTTVGNIRNGLLLDDDGNPRYVKSQACSVSQYFGFGDSRVQIRTSGYAKFSDTEIPQEILDGTPINIKGIYTVYTNRDWTEYDYQFTLLNNNIGSLDEGADIEIVK